MWMYPAGKRDTRLLREREEIRASTEPAATAQPVPIGHCLFLCFICHQKSLNLPSMTPVIKMSDTLLYCHKHTPCCRCAYKNRSVEKARIVLYIYRQVVGPGRLCSVWAGLAPLYVGLHRTNMSCPSCWDSVAPFYWFSNCYSAGQTVLESLACFQRSREGHHLGSSAD